jgi:hypothetical protein
MPQVYDTRPITGPATPSAKRDRGQRGVSEDRGQNPTLPMPTPDISSIPLPAMTPESTAAYYARLATLDAQLGTDLAALRAQRVGLKADARVARADVRAGAIEGMAGQVNSALETNTFGSSMDVAGRVGVRATAAREKAQVGADLREGLAMNRIQEQQTALGYQLAGQELEAGRAAEIQGALADQLLNNTIMSGMESQVDALQAVYEALAQRTGRPGRGRAPALPSFAPIPGVVGGFTSNSTGTWQVGGGF